ncbi:MAG: DUF1329 domain-containing protein [Deltaproteobacteria bacterium]|nr:DUF1329 domain-containing protein [Deltaproteobacteria bacterium]
MNRFTATVFVLASLATAVTALRAAADQLPIPGPLEIVGAHPWSLPPAGECEPGGGLAAGPFQDASPPLPFVPGQVLDMSSLPTLRVYLPPEIWEHRDSFFFDGMQLEVGACFADYSPPGFFAEATDIFGGQARLLPNGGLENHVAGLPFPPHQIAVADADAGQKWAWNFERRYRAGGFRGRFRIEDLLGEHSKLEPFEGEIFQVQLGARADRPADGYRFPDSEKYAWAAGGRFSEPFLLNDFAWLQFRSAESQGDPRRTDDLHIWVPALSKIRRAPAGDLEGLFTPVAKVGVASGGSDKEKAEVEPKRSGFEGLELRPLLYRFSVLGIQDVLTPINARRPVYPADDTHGFGPSALAWSSDRWDVRRSLILEGRRRDAESPGRARVRMWIDVQTMQPLYYSSYDENDRRVDVGYFVGRWSEGRDKYPRWPDDEKRAVRIVDSAGAAFLNLKLKSSWRRESWDMISIPQNDRRVRRSISLQSLRKSR